MWIMATYGEKYCQGAWCGTIRPDWTVEDFRDFVKTSSGHYNQMFKATWTKFAYDQTAWGTYGLGGAYMYISYGN